MQRGRVGDHRPKLEHPELALPDADSAVHEEQRAPGVDLDRSGDEEPHGQTDDEHEEAHDQVETAFHGPVPAGQHGRTQLEERSTLSRHVFPALDEELGRIGREPHLHSLAMRLLDHLEHRALVEVRLGKDYLVGLDLVEYEWKLGACAEKPEAGHGRRRDGADELVGQPAASTGERALEPDEALPRADEHDAPADARRSHELERDRLVRGTQQSDRDSRYEHRRRDETRGAEVVARPDPEGEDDQRNDDEAREDTARARSVFPRAVETGLGEDQDRYGRSELEPLRGALPPKKSPQDVSVPGDDLAHDERDVDAECEPGDVEHDERADGQRPPDDRDDGPTREHVQARGSNVTSGCGLRGSRTRRLRRRSDLCHA